MNETSERQASGLRAIAALASDFSERKRPDEQIQAVLSAALEVLEVEQAVLAVMDPTGSTLTVRAASPALTGGRFERGSLAWTVAAFGRPEVVPDLAADPRRVGVPAELMVRRTLCVPIRIAGAGRGVLLVGSMEPGACVTDAIDLFLLEVLANVAAGVLVQEVEEIREQRFHARLERLATYAVDGDRRARVLDAVVRGIAQRQGIPSDEADPCLPLLAELCLATRAKAAAVALLGPDGNFRIERACGLSAEVRSAWCESAEAAKRLHEDGGRMTSILPGADSGFAEAGLDLRVLISSGTGERILHVLSPRERMAFSREDARCSEIAAVQLGARADRAAAMAEIAALRALHGSDRGTGVSALAAEARILDPEFLQPLDAP